MDEKKATAILATYVRDENLRCIVVTASDVYYYAPNGVQVAHERTADDDPEEPDASE